MRLVGELCGSCGCCIDSHFHPCVYCSNNAEYCDCDEELDYSSKPPESFRCQCGNCEGYDKIHIDFASKNVRVDTPVVLHDAPVVDDSAFALSFSPEGSSLAALFRWGLEVWACSSWESVYSLPLSCEVRWGFEGSLVWSSTGDRLAVAGTDEILLIEMDSANAARRFQSGSVDRTVTAEGISAFGQLAAQDKAAAELLLQAKATRNRAVTFSPDGSQFAEAGEQLLIFDTESGRLLEESYDTNFYLCCARWHPSESIVAAGNEWGSSVWLFDTQRGSLIRSLTHGWGLIRSLCWNAQGDLLVSGAGDGTAVIWDPASREQLCTIQLREDPVDEQIWGEPVSNDRFESLAWSPDGSLLAGGSRGLRVWPVVRDDASA